MNDKQDAYEGSLDTCSILEKSKASPVGGDMFSVTPWTEANMNNYQTSKDSLKTICGKLSKQETDFTDVNPMGEKVETEGYCDVLATNGIEENGYGSLLGKRRSAMTSTEKRLCQYGHNIYSERPNASEAPSAVDSLSKGNRNRTESDTRHCETWKIKDAGPQEQRDYNKTGNSEVTKIVPLKPQRSKKSLNKENKDVNPRTQSPSDGDVADVTVDVHVTESKDRLCEAGRRADDKTVPQSAVGAVKENKGPTKYQSKAAMSHQQQSQWVKKELLGQQELRDFRGTTEQSQCSKGGMLHEDHFHNQEGQESFLCSSKAPTAPPRTLPLKTQWSRDRQSNVDNSHIHYRLPGQETSKRKQAVNHRPALFVHHRKVKHQASLHELRTVSCKCFDHPKTKSHTYFRTHVAVYKKAKVHIPPHCIIGRESFLLSVVPFRKA